MTPPRTCRTAFSLVELSVVIVVVALVVGFGISLGGNAIRAAERVTTQERLATIKNVLDTHFKNYGYLPCPYDRSLTPSDAAFGLEARPALGDPCTTSTSMVTSPDGAVFIGGIPVRSLGLPDSYAADAWGNKFTYGVSANLTDSAANYYTTIPQLQIYSGDRTGSPYSLTTVVPDLTPGPGAAYIVISHGPDGRGAYPLDLDSIAIACGAGAQNDVGNCDDSGDFYDTAYNDGANEALYFDDFVVWGSNALSTAPTILAWGSCSAKCEAWCAPCGPSGSAVASMPGLPTPATAGNFSKPHLCRKILTSSTPSCVASCVWAGTMVDGTVVRCP